MPDSELECQQVMSYIGPILREYGSVKLAKMGYVSKCNIKVLHVDYKTKPKGEYNEVKDEVFNNAYRMGLITEIVRKCDGSVLLLVGKVEDEGAVLKKHLEESGVLEDREICFLSGKDNAKEREIWRRYTDEQSHIVLVATYGIFSTGINIKSLRYLVLASPFKSKIRVLQSIGRTLRLHADKVNGATVFDICDTTKYLREHGDIRMKHYAKEGFDIEEIFLVEQGLLPDDLFIIT
jgi:superfamily II DNA or RNA helicase